MIKVILNYDYRWHNDDNLHDVMDNTELNWATSMTFSTMID